jgi:hypothetical protein
MQPPLAEIAGVNLVIPYSSRPDAAIAELPHEFDTPAAKRRGVTMVAASDGYLAVWIMPNSMTGPGSIDATNPYHTEPLQLLVLCRLTGRWQKLELSTAVTTLTHPPVRIFGDLLVTTTMEWRSERRRSKGPVIEHGRPPLPNEEVPDAPSEFLNRFSHLYIPGKLVLQNLSDDRKLILNTGQEDSEVVAIRVDGAILYRINDTTYSAEIVGN